MQPTWPAPTRANRPSDRRVRRWPSLLLGIVLGAAAMLLTLLVLAPPGGSAAPRTSATPTGQARLIADDAFVTDLVQRSLTNGTLPVPLRNPQARVETGGIRITATAEAPAGLPAPTFSALARPEVRAGEVVFTLTEAHIGAAPVPAALVSALEERLHSRLRGITALSGYRVVAVSTAPNALTLTLAR